MTDLDHRAEAIHLLDLADGSEQALTLVQAAQVHAMLRAGDLQQQMLDEFGSAKQLDATLQTLRRVEARLAAVFAECRAIEEETEGQHDEDDDGMREAVARIRRAAEGAGA
ncbi:hypothetical protein [Streptomyces sp. XY533]|uniref:hypothetical protein n=1 Tax=Streptomyces sp. XY533 TaxID=1519481 RepID=UPI0006AE9610|nr:hypothetical protein [Streptomyces sp. XY533]KOV07485.1 hypothetical protein ADK92_05560 [Streptomyces sp. XY533]